jgi:DNA (cytosine-5)-methyltransferase 1
MSEARGERARVAAVPARRGVRDRGGCAMSRPKLLDLFCGAGGCSVGYARAGFDVVGVDNMPHPDYPFPMFVADAIEFIEDGWIEAGNFDAVHASPPCPRYSVATPSAARDKHPDLVAPVRELLRATGLPYVIENVPGAPLDTPILLCGSMFDLGVRRHRLFETNAPALQPECATRTSGDGVRRLWCAQLLAAIEVAA